VDNAVKKAEAAAQAAGESAEEAHTDANNAVKHAAADHDVALEEGGKNWSKVRYTGKQLKDSEATAAAAVKASDAEKGAAAISKEAVPHDPVNAAILEIAEPAGEDTFDAFMAKAQKEAEDDLSTTTNALTGHLSVSAIPASQLQKLAAMAQQELAKRSNQGAAQTPDLPVPIPEELMSVDAAAAPTIPPKPKVQKAEPKPVQTPPVSLDQTPQKPAKPSMAMPPMGPPVAAKAVAEAPPAPKPPAQLSMDKPARDIASIIKASVAQALGKSGVKYDERAVDAALLQENAT